MKTMRYLLIAAAALTATFAFTACDDDSTTEKVVVKTDTVEVPSSNWERYQRLVTEDVKQHKQHDKVILLVAFGSTWEQAFSSFDATIEAYKTDTRFAGYDVFLSYSSAICINRAAAAEHGVERHYYAPPFWLNAFAAKGVQYREIVVQSLQVIPGEEYTRVINYIKDFANNSNGDLDDQYLANVTLKLGVPLLQDKTEDVPEVAKRLDALYGSKIQETDKYMLFMGHGNPDSYDTYKANVRYTDLEEELQKLNPRYFVGTVDMMENFKTHVHQRMIAAGFTSGTVYCHPLMSIDGDHGHNDMGGDDCPEGVTTFDQLEANEEGEVEDCSWKVYFDLAGYTCTDDTQIHLGLLELETIRDVWMSHTKDAIDGEPLDYYHSAIPEEE